MPILQCLPLSQPNFPLLIFFSSEKLIQKMKFTFLAWFFIFLCGRAMSNMADEGKPTSKREDFSLSETDKHGQVHGVNRTQRLNGDDERKEYRGNHELFHSTKKGKKGKGVYGGANIVHRPRHRERNAAILTAKPSFFVSATMLCVSWALVLMFFPILS